MADGIDPELLGDDQDAAADAVVSENQLNELSQLLTDADAAGDPGATIEDDNADADAELDRLVLGYDGNTASSDVATADGWIESFARCNVVRHEKRSALWTGTVDEKAARLIKAGDTGKPRDDPTFFVYTCSETEGCTHTTISRRARQRRWHKRSASLSPTRPHSPARASRLPADTPLLQICPSIQRGTSAFPHKI